MKSTATANPVLSALAVKYMQDPKYFVARRLFPNFATGEQSASYYVLDEANGLNVPTLSPRALSSQYSRSKMTLSDDTYFCKEYGHEEPVDDAERKKYANAFDADNSAIQRIINVLMVNQELRVKTIATGASVPTSSPTNKWDNYSTSTPIKDVQVAKRSIFAGCGQEANIMVVNRDVRDWLLEHPTILDKIKYTQTGIASEQLLAMVFGVDQVLVAGVQNNSAADGQAVTAASIWLDAVILAHVDPRPDLKAPNFGRCFDWTASIGAGGLAVESYREDDINSDIHRARQFCDEKLTGAKAGYYLSDVLASI